jgi:hypothetical protein
MKHYLNSEFYRCFAFITTEEEHRKMLVLPVFVWVENHVSHPEEKT